MSVEVAATEDGDIFIFMSPSRDLSLPVLRIEPDCIYLSPEGNRTGTEGGIILAYIPTEISEKDWRAYCASKTVALSYDIKSRNGYSIISHTGFIGCSHSSTSYLEMLPVDDFSLALSIAIKDRMDPKYKHEIPEVIDANIVYTMESNCLSGVDKFMIPCFDLCGSEQKVWLVDDLGVTRKFGLTIDDLGMGDVISNMTNTGSSSLSQKADNSYKYMGDTLEVSERTGISYISSSNVLDRLKGDDYKGLLGVKFRYDEKVWEVEDVVPPMSSGSGWLLSVISEDGFISGLSGEYVDILANNPDPALLLEWTPLHRRHFFQSKLEVMDVGEGITNKEFWGDEYRVSNYLVVNDSGFKKFDRLNSTKLSIWKKRKAFEKLKNRKKKKKNSRLNALSKLASKVSSKSNRTDNTPKVSGPRGATDNTSSIMKKLLALKAMRDE